MEHRRLLSRWLATLNLDTDPTSLVLTGGAQQALALAFELSCGREGVILTERLTYPGAITLCRHRAYRMRGVAIDDEGIVPSSLATALDATPSTGRKAVYVTPNLHNPTTATMSLGRRQAVVELCRARDAWIVEDGVYTTGAEDTPPLAALAPERTFYVGSLSKTLSPGLRIGVLVVPPGMEHSAEMALQAFPLSPSPLSCAVVEDWLANGVIDSLRMGLREEALRRSHLAASLLNKKTLVCHPGAYHAWLPMPRHVASQFSIAAASLGVAVTPPEAIMVDPKEDSSGIRLCLGGPPFDELTKALTLLSGVGHAGSAPSPSLSV